MKLDMDVVFLGGKQAGCVGLLAVAAAGGNVLGAVSYDDQVARLTSILEIPSFSSVRETPVKKLLEQADLIVCVHGREILSRELLELPGYGGINVHPCVSKYRGAHPIEKLLADRGSLATVGVHRMEERVDEGEILVEEFVEIGTGRSVEEVYNLLYPTYSSVLIKALCAIKKQVNR